MLNRYLELEIGLGLEHVRLREEEDGVGCIVPVLACVHNSDIGIYKWIQLAHELHYKYVSLCLKCDAYPRPRG